MTNNTNQLPFTLAGALAGYRQCLPIAFGVFTVGLVFGVVARQAGLSLLEAAVMSMSVLAGSAQLIAVDMWTVPVPVAAIVVTTFLVNARYLLMGAALRPWFAGLDPWRIYGSMFFLTDENWALTMKQYRSSTVDGAFLLGSGLAIWTFWLGATVIGFTAGTLLEDPAAWGLDFALTTVFITLLAGIWEGKRDVLPASAAALTAVAAMQLVPGQWYILMGGLAGGLIGAMTYKDDAGP